MRAVLTFEATGTDHKELCDKVLDVYKKYMNIEDSSAKLPSSTTIEISPDAIETSSDGSGGFLTWSATVTIPVVMNE